MPNDSVDKSSWESSACYPRRTFDPLSESPSTRDSRITMADFRLCLTSRSHSQAGLYHYANQSEAYLRAPPLLFRRHPPQINYPPRSVPPDDPNDRLGILRRKSGLSGLVVVTTYTFDLCCHCEAIVKVHGVLPSSRWYSASSRRIQFHRVHVGDSGAVVTPFVQVATYATRNFATLGQLELLPPFTGASIQSL